MSLFSSFMKWKLRWAALTGFITLIVLPIARLVFKKKSTSKASASGEKIIDVEAEEILKNSQR